MKKRRFGTVKHQPVLIPASIYRVGSRVSCRLCLGDWELSDSLKAAQYLREHGAVHADGRS